MLSLSLPTDIPTLVPGDARVQRLVVLCASAGGMEAIEELVSLLSCEAPMCMVVALHQSEGGISHVAEMLQPRTDWPVRVVEQGTRLEAGRLLVMPPGVTLGFIDGGFKPVPAPRGVSRWSPIDELLEQLAQQFEGELIAVMLSGAGSDGARGCAEVAMRGGRVLAQSPATAAFDSMPRSVISAGLASFVGAPAELALRLYGSLESTALLDENASTSLAAALRLLLSQGPPDFRFYKRGLLVRRVKARAQRLGHLNSESYVNALPGDVDELDQLRRDFLISVTSPFRDEAAWRSLDMHVLRPLVDARAVARAAVRPPLRAWVCASATGEEAYTLAMLLATAFLDAGLPLNFQVFATDVSEANVEIARAGRYSAQALAAVPEPLRQRWLVRDGTGDGFVFREELRRVLVFARHDMLRDAPFSNIDIVCCRNLLIYLLPQGQNDVLDRIERAVRPGGHVLLGIDETPPDCFGTWSAVDLDCKLYQLPLQRRFAMPASGPTDVSAARADEPLALEDLLSLGEVPTPGTPEAVAAHHAYQATAEQLRSTNESLQCSNEELLTVNDELNRVNAELGRSVARERLMVAELQGVIDATGAPLIVVDHQLHIERYSPEATRLFRLRQGDEGRQLGDFACDLLWPELCAILRACIQNGQSHDREVRDIRGRWWLVRIVPIHGVNRPSRAVISFTEVTNMRDAVRLQAVLDSLPQQVAVLSAVGRIEMVNEAWRAFARRNGADPGGTDVGVDYLGASRSPEHPADAHAERACGGVSAVLARAVPSFRMSYPCATPLADMWFVLDVSPLERPEGGCVVSHTDITEWLNGASPS